MSASINIYLYLILKIKAFLLTHNFLLPKLTLFSPVFYFLVSPRTLRISYMAQIHDPYMIWIIDRWSYKLEQLVSNNDTELDSNTYWVPYTTHGRLSETRLTIDRQLQQYQPLLLGNLFPNFFCTDGFTTYLKLSTTCVHVYIFYLPFRHSPTGFLIVNTI